VKRVLLLACLFFSTGAALAAAPRSIQSVYDLHYGGTRIGEVKESFTRDDRQYSIESVASAIGPLALILPGPLMLSSKGQITPEGLKPLAFSSRQGNNEKKAYFADFHWDNAILTLRKHDKQEEHELHSGTLDTLTLIYQFLFTPPVSNARTDFYLTTGKKLHRYAYHVVGEEKIKTPLGLINAIHISKIVTTQSDSAYDVWVDKDRFFVPVRVVAKDDGRTVEQVLRTITIN
jgi:Protein of unknown function (DUF3108)